MGSILYGPTDCTSPKGYCQKSQQVSSWPMVQSPCHSSSVSTSGTGPCRSPYNPQFSRGQSALLTLKRRIALSGTRQMSPISTVRLVSPPLRSIHITCSKRTGWRGKSRNSIPGVRICSALRNRVKREDIAGMALVKMFASTRCKSTTFFRVSALRIAYTRPFTGRLNVTCRGHN